MSFLDAWFTGKDFAGETANPILSKILETMRESVIVVSEDTRIIASNTAAYNAFARKNGVLEGRRLSEVIRDLSLHETFRKVLREEKSYAAQLEIPGSENQKFNVHIAPLDLEQKKGAIGVFYDITQIERLENVRQEFLSNISHELRTPLTSILAFVETLEDGAIEDKENNQRFLSVIRKNAQRMHHLIDDILELSTIESGKINIELKHINLAAQVEEIFVNLSNKAADRQIELINRVPADVRVFADNIRLEQMLTNLIDNAIKFNRQSGTVVVTHSLDKSRDIIAVADAGEGLSGEHMQRIFERFYRTDRARSREIGGTGLGLAIVKHLSRLHGGEVSVSSIPGKGTVFSIELPVEATENR